MFDKTKQKKTKKETVPKTPQMRALEDLNELGRNLMEKSLTDPKTPLTSALQQQQQQPVQQQLNLSLNDLIKTSALPSSTAAATDDVFTRIKTR